MSAGHRRSSTPITGAVILLGLIGLCGHPAAGDNRDALSRPEFDREISIRMEQMDAIAVFRSISAATGVPFVLRFDNDPTLTISLEATNMVCRGILESLANTYSLDYTATTSGIVVHHRGTVPNTKGLVLSPPAKKPAPAYWFDLYLRDTQARVQRFQRLSRPAGVTEASVFYMDGRDVTITVLSQQTGEITRRNVGTFELAIGVKRDNGSSLDLVAELTTRRPLGEMRYSESHTVASPSVDAGETVLFTTEGGDAIVLAAWGRLGAGARELGDVP